MKYSMSYNNIIPALILMTLIAACNDNINSTENYNIDLPSGPPGSRNYTWEVDTIHSDVFQFSFSRWWGASSDDIWMICSGSSTKNLLRHYDGEKWEKRNELYGYRLFTIYGSSYDDVWTSGAGGYLLHYDGQSWSERFKIQPPEGCDMISIVDICRLNEENYIGVGTVRSSDDIEDYSGIIVTFNQKGYEIKRYMNDFPDTISLNWVYRIDDNTAAFSGLNFIENKNWVFTYDLKNNRYHKLLEMDLFINKAEIGCESYTRIYKILYKVFKQKIVEVVNYSDEYTYPSGAVSGRSSQDLFISAMIDNNTLGILHYNGTDYEYLYTTSNILNGAPLIFNKDIFYPEFDFSTKTQMVIHGRLQE